MAFMNWTDKFSVGIPSIDAQHKKLVSMVNELFDAMKSGHGKDAVGKTLAGLIQYTLTHFDYEEKLFAQTGYPDTAAHKKEHEDLKKKVVAMQEKIKIGTGAAQSMEVMEFLKNWLNDHILGTDKKYGPHLASKGVK